MVDNTILQTLSKVKAFDGLTEDDLRLFLSHCKEASFNKDEVITKAGDSVNSFNIIVSGQLKVFLPETVEGDNIQRFAEIQLNILNEGDCFGEYSLIKKTTASASIIGIEAGELIKISDTAFNKILSINDRITKTIYYNLLCMLIDRLGKREEEYDIVLVSS
ncbi:MAG: cyclic nucleotide-binding domain-containing protein [bacterium]